VKLNPYASHVVQQQVDGDTLIDSSHQKSGSSGKYGQSEPAPTSAPVGCSVHRMMNGLRFFHPVPDLVLTQHRTTVNPFWAAHL
jgi:hypothetical protein